MKWVVSGVAAELAARLNASVVFIRVLMVAAFLLAPDRPITAAYVLAALLIPRGGARRPSWSALIAAARFGLLVLIVQVTSAAGMSLDVVFRSGPERWIPLGGIELAALIALFAWRPAVGDLDEQRCRTWVLAGAAVALPPAAVAAGIVLAPDVRWDPILAAALIAVGAGVAVTRERAAIVPAAALAGVTLTLATADGRLQGGVGDLALVPRQAEPITARRAIGDVVVDLSALPQATTAVSIDASTGIGAIRVVVPNDARVDADVRIGRGRWGADEGFESRRHVTETGRGMLVRVAADAGIGEVRLVRMNGNTIR